MTGRRLTILHRSLVTILVTVYLVAGIAGLFADFDSTRDTVFWVVFLCGGAASILVGAVLAKVSAWLSAVLVSMGAAAGGIALVWTVIVPIAAAILIAMSFSFARQSKPA